MNSKRYKDYTALCRLPGLLGPAETKPAGLSEVKDLSGPPSPGQSVEMGVGSESSLANHHQTGAFSCSYQTEGCQGMVPSDTLWPVLFLPVVEIVEPILLSARQGWLLCFQGAGGVSPEMSHSVPAESYKPEGAYREQQRRARGWRNVRRITES